MKSPLLPVHADYASRSVCYRARHVAWMALAMLVIGPGLVHAQVERRSQGSLAEPVTAPGDYQNLITQGLSAYAANRFVEARALFAQAHALTPNARTLRVLGVADLALDNFAMAKDELAAALVHPTLPLTPEQRKEVNGLLEWMKSSLGTVHLECTPVQADAQIDGKLVTAPDVLLEPDEHHLTVSAQGFVSHDSKFRLAVTQHLTLHVDLVAVPKQPTAAAEPTQTPAVSELPPPQVNTAPESQSSVALGDQARLWPWVGGAGAVLLAGGATLFALGLSDIAKVEDAPLGVRWSSIKAPHDRGPRLANTGLALGLVGVAGLTTAVILLLTEQPETPRTEHQPVAWTVRAGPTQFSIERNF